MLVAAAGDSRRTVLIVSASMGGGHDGAARELARRVDAEGHQAVVVDFLDSFPLHIGHLLRRFYRMQLGSASWSYNFAYWLTERVRAVYQPFVLLIWIFTARSLRRRINEVSPSVIVSTYPFSALLLGRWRAKGRLKVPVVTFVTDFAVHALWVHSGVDLHLCVHDSSTTRAGRLSEGPAITTGPLVAPRFPAQNVTKEEAREALGLPQDRLLALVVAGAWGLGDVRTTFQLIARTGSYDPVAVCGTNSKLKEALRATGLGHVLGWTDQMPLLMAACDVLVQNAGGLSCMEAFASGLPVVTFHPVAGHGRHNARQMAIAGVAQLAQTAEQLLPTLERATSLSGRSYVAAGKALFVRDAAREVLSIAQVPVPVSEAVLKRVRRPVRLAAASAVSIASAYFGLNLVAGLAVAHGLDAVQTSTTGRDAYVAVRIGPSALASPRLARLLRADRVTPVVDGLTVEQHPSDLRRLTSQGIQVDDGGWGPVGKLHVVQPSSGIIESVHEFREVLGNVPLQIVSYWRVNGADVVSAMVEKVRIARPAKEASAAVSLGADLSPGKVYVLDATHDDISQLARSLSKLDNEAAARHIAIRALS